VGRFCLFDDARSEGKRHVSRVDGRDVWGADAYAIL